MLFCAVVLLAITALYIFIMPWIFGAEFYKSGWEQLGQSPITHSITHCSAAAPSWHPYTRHGSFFYHNLSSFKTTCIDAESPWKLHRLRREVVKEIIPPGVPRGRQEAANGIILHVMFPILPLCCYRRGCLVRNLRMLFGKC